MLRNKSLRHENDVFKKLDMMYYYGMRLLLFGMTPDGFHGKCSYKHIMLYAAVILFLVLYGLGELLYAIIVPGNILERLGHLYVSTYCIPYGIIWVYMAVKLKDIQQNHIDFESFSSTKLIANFDAEELVQKNIDALVKTVVLLAIVINGNILSYVLGAIVQYVVQYWRTGTLEEVFVFSYFPLPLWGQMIVAVANIVTSFMFVPVVVPVYAIMGLLSLEIETQCQFLTRAMSCHEVNDTDDIKAFVVDHIRLIKHTKWVIKLFENVNSLLFFTLYMAFAIEMFILTVVEADGFFYLGIFSDFCAQFIILGSQCWLSSTITTSMMTISEGVYNTSWFRKNKRKALDVIFMTQMAQRPHIQRVFLGTMKIDRGTMIDVIQQSYSFYAILMILQSKK